MTAQIQLATAAVGEVVEAEIFGPFGIHVADGWDARQYVLTHVRSGYSVDNLPTKAAAFRLARKLVAARLNWHFREPTRMPKRTRARASAIVRAYRDERRAVV